MKRRLKVGEITFKDLEKQIVEIHGNNLFTRIIFKIFGRYLNIGMGLVLIPPSHPNCRCRTTQSKKENTE